MYACMYLVFAAAERLDDIWIRRQPEKAHQFRHCFNMSAALEPKRLSNFHSWIWSKDIPQLTWHEAVAADSVRFVFCIVCTELGSAPSRDVLGPENGEQNRVIVWYFWPGASALSHVIPTVTIFYVSSTVCARTRACAAPNRARRRITLVVLICNLQRSILIISGLYFLKNYTELIMNITDTFNKTIKGVKRRKDLRLYKTKFKTYNAQYSRI